MNDIQAVHGDEGTGFNLSIELTFPVSVEALWDAWEDPEQLCEWMGPEEVVSCEALVYDLREGGDFRLRMIDREGLEHIVGGTYQRVEKPRLMVFSWSWDDEDWEPSLVSVEFEPGPEGAAMKLVHTKFAAIEGRERHDYGWRGSFDKLSAMLAR